MENIFTATSQRSVSEKSIVRNLPVESEIYANLKAEGGENFFEYLQKVGLSEESSTILLPSSHHYYYDAEDLRDIRTVVNLKELNKIRQPKDFLRTIYHILPQQSYFIGSFIDGKNQLGIFPSSSATEDKENGVDPVENGISSRIPFLNMIYDLMDAKVNRLLTRKAVTGMLKDMGFIILDITEIKGLTYFTVQKSNFL